MGLHLSSIASFPAEANRRYYVYFLDYGWDEELSRAMYDNFARLAEEAEKDGYVVMRGIHREHFANEVLSWHSINTESSSDLLPGIMITDTNPQKLSDSNMDTAQYNSEPLEGRDSVPSRFILIPLSEYCKTSADVTKLLEEIAQALSKGLPLANFSIVPTSQRGNKLADALILKPTFMGMGVDLKELFRLGRGVAAKKRLGVDESAKK